MHKSKYYSWINDPKFLESEDRISELAFIMICAILGLFILFF